MRGNANRTHSRSPTAVRNAKSLMQIEMTNIRADFSRTTKPDLRVHVGSIHVDLAPVFVHQIGSDQEGFLRFYAEEVLPKV